MRILFRGWRREIKPHERTVSPVNHDGATYRLSTKQKTLSFNSSTEAFGKLTDLGLSGNFLVTFTFEPQELHDWCAAYVKDRPDAALRLASKMLADAIVELTSRGSLQNVQA
jgi:hypothetical protein